MEDFIERYQAHSPRSRALYERARSVLPGGTTRTSVFYAPYPLYLSRGEGCRVWDADGRGRIDFNGNATSQIHGHGHPAVVEAVRRQAERGVSFGAPSEAEVRLAEVLCERVPSVEQVRFTSSGTEAVMYALRAARAFTGRRKIAKCEGGFHGAHDSVHVSFSAGDPAGPEDRFEAQPESQGMIGYEDTVIFPFNDIARTEAILERHGGDLAAVILEPVPGSRGCLPPDPAFLRMLREATARLGIVLIFDEVMCLRVSYRGAQGRYGVTPDLTTMGKIVGGGLPLAAFGGRRDLMALLDPSGGPMIPHTGTFNGAALAAAAGAAAMEALTPEAFERFERLGERLRAGLGQVFRRREVKAQVTGVGSMFKVHTTDRRLRTLRDTAHGDRRMSQQLFFGLLHRGILPFASGMGCLSTPMGEAEVDAFVKAVDETLVEDMGY
ncbi:MAG: hypothetical protein A3F84_03155 [Candidatus Handelsmanbacteria bacterium RIFCSPLOWO2_12_FULL_64_10]|uniref:glutamate-1-semialdehyde 2,1-aminomutase n=1 Tax=Handelsmanbacteria sp. (strain RIFCSPLOWO2_12_FULL_64_10) TaxID=1817868 RepID=A0A1F6C6L6_HANXR|nr:MAG: hypothetical protein A3F84_03155 [Candidatus Handelsmanbacteria bacterium RIFCSPLOWO2_12_FULL_64_10]